MGGSAAVASGGRLGEVKMASGGFRHRVCSLSLLLLLFLYSYLGGNPVLAWLRGLSIRLG